MEIRVYMLGLLFLLLLFLCSALGAVAIVHPFVYPQDDPAPPLWDRYSKRVGIEARQAFARIVSAYVNPYYFPAPLNILHFLLIQFPTAVLILSGRTVPSGLMVAERVLWRVTVAPFVFLLSGFWLWNLRAR